MTRTDHITPPSALAPIVCVVDNTLRHVRVFSDAEWAAIDPADRPAPAEHFRGLGWVAAVAGRAD